MLIANPLYDVVFKYLMEDNRAAKAFLSAFLNAEILELDFMPQELAVEVEKPFKNKSKKTDKQTLEDQIAATISQQTGLSIYRLDFAAKIRTPEGGEMLIIIELQKSKMRSDVMRFRSYLGRQYMRAELFRWHLNQQGRRFKAGIPILPIYILGEGVAEYEGTPVVLVEICPKDNSTRIPLHKNSSFLASVFHEGYVVNVPELSHRRKDALEQLLGIFDQSQVDESHHIMNISEQDYEERYRPVIRRLQQAVESKEVRQRMQAEDEVLSDFAEYEREFEEMKTQLEENQTQIAQISAEKQKAQAEKQKAEAEKQKAQAEKQKAEAEKQKAQAEKQKAEAEKQKAEAEKQKAETTLRTSIAMMLQAGMSPEAIAKGLAITSEEFDRLK